MKRFYTMVTAPHVDGAYEIHLDGKPIYTPAKNTLRSESQNLAAALVQEWADQGEKIIPATMPLTQITNTRIDKIANDRGVIIDQLIKYIDTDLVFYRVEIPEKTAEAQVRLWDPVIKSCADRFGIKLSTTTDLIVLKQPPEAHEKIAAHINALDADQLTILQLATPLCGSLLTGILFTDGKLSAEEVIAIARAEEHVKDEVYNAEKYGPDPSLEKSESAMRIDLEAAAEYLSLVQ